ncbi:hypothetical protein [Paracoccus benzoatiresistens]|uniref:Hemolysin type calcium-binding protein n=1 Tax=Paracoccus benzoatiresistens TaxID=2997341 RepID=A0ABT4J5Z8_9RHOB|nr:hypothetical protein [Paracoccus sp. EF6]MCZ0962519.1 hypothetical protein [Paracoccus sp. EF6]
MEDDEIELLTADESGQVKTASGGLGQDAILSRILAEILASGNSHMITGDEGRDLLYLDTYAEASNGTTAAAIGNTISASGGDDEDTFDCTLRAAVSDGGSASVSGNSVFMRGDDGNDSYYVVVQADANAGGEAICSDNVMTLDGGRGDDSLSVYLETYPWGPGTTAAVSGNRIFMSGGEGNDEFLLSTQGETGNSAVLDGGAGIDKANIFHDRPTEDVIFDFRDSYDQVLFGGVTLVGMDAINIDGGLGDDQFWGGDGDDDFRDGLGSDLVHGGRGADNLSHTTRPLPSGSDTEQYSNEHDRFWGGKGNDHLQAHYTIRSPDNGRGIMTHNSARLYGCEGDDTLESSMFAEPLGRDSTVIMTDNVLDLRGGEGEDVLSADLRDWPWPESTATYMDNRIDLRGGCGDDSLRLEASSAPVLSDNRITLDGGRGHDRFELDLDTFGTWSFSLSDGSSFEFSDSINFDFSDGYDVRLVGGTRLKGFEEVLIYAGIGDDTFQGGCGNDTFDGGDGVDVVILDGARCDYEVDRLDDGRIRITDLRQGSPGGTDLFIDIEALSFDDRFHELT